MPVKRKCKLDLHFDPFRNLCPCASAANEGRVMFMKEEHENRELNFFQNLLIFSDFCVILENL